MAMSRALGAAFLHHQVEQLEKSVSSSSPTNVNWRDRRDYTNKSAGAGRRGSNPALTKVQPKKNPAMNGTAEVASRERAPAVVKDLGRNISTSPSSKRHSTLDPKKEKDADIVVIDGSVLIHALYQVKKWCREGREEVLIVPLEGLISMEHFWIYSENSHSSKYP